ncbi:MAG: hypothetical protein JO131_04610, partial [Gammaproteobacteria bacterium]|nr:hypothetical protein [Gammaproteobacteria bacterium]
KMSGADEQRLFHEKIDMLMECLPLKEEYLNARMRMLGDITNYSVDNENDLATSSTKDEVENDSTASSTRHALLNDTTDSNKRDRLEYNPTISHAKNGFFNHPPQEKTVTEENSQSLRTPLQPGNNKQS